MVCFCLNFWSLLFTPSPSVCQPCQTFRFSDIQNFYPPQVLCTCCCLCQCHSLPPFPPSSPAPLPPASSPLLSPPLPLHYHHHLHCHHHLHHYSIATTTTISTSTLSPPAGDTLTSPSGLYSPSLPLFISLDILFLHSIQLSL